MKRTSDKERMEDDEGEAAVPKKSKRIAARKAAAGSDSAPKVPKKKPPKTAALAEAASEDKHCPAILMTKEKHAADAPLQAPPKPRFAAIVAAPVPVAAAAVVAPEAALAPPLPPAPAPPMAPGSVAGGGRIADDLTGDGDNVLVGERDVIIHYEYGDVPLLVHAVCVAMSGRVFLEVSRCPGPVPAGASLHPRPFALNWDFKEARQGEIYHISPTYLIGVYHGFGAVGAPVGSEWVRGVYDESLEKRKDQERKHPAVAKQVVRVPPARATACRVAVVKAERAAAAPVGNCISVDSMFEMLNKQNEMWLTRFQEQEAKVSERTAEQMQKLMCISNAQFASFASAMMGKPMGPEWQHPR
eukprot:m51a1_g11486 hypothetical protein (358) ;mRNA; r:8534-10118